MDTHGVTCSSLIICLSQSIHPPQNRNQAIKLMLRDLYEKQASTLGGVTKTIDETSHGFGRNMMEMKEFVKAQRTYNVSGIDPSLPSQPRLSAVGLPCVVPFGNRTYSSVITLCTI